MLPSAGLRRSPENAYESDRERRCATVNGAPCHRIHRERRERLRHRLEEPVRATRRAARDDPDPQIHAKETILHLLRPLFSHHLPHNKPPRAPLRLDGAWSPGSQGSRSRCSQRLASPQDLKFRCPPQQPHHRHHFSCQDHDAEGVEQCQRRGGARKKMDHRTTPTTMATSSKSPPPATPKVDARG